MVDHTDSLPGTGISASPRASRGFRTLTECSSHTAPAVRLTLSIARRRSHAFRFPARLLPAPTRQARRATHAHSRLPDLVPLLEVWEHDLLPWETAPPAVDNQALPWQGASFSWEPASRHTVPFAGCSTPTRDPGGESGKSATA
jgi:hypothetical protein